MARFVNDTLKLAGWDVEIADAVKVKGLCAARCQDRGALSGESYGRVGSCLAALRARLVLDPSGLCLLNGHARDNLFRQPQREDKPRHEPSWDRPGRSRESGFRTDSSANDGPELVLRNAKLVTQDSVE